MSSVFGGQAIQPQTPPSYFQQVYGQNAQGQPTGYPGQQEFLNAVQTAAFDQGGLKGLPGYGGPLSPNVGSTMLPNVWGAWSPNTPDMGYTQGALNTGQQSLGAAYNAWQSPYSSPFGGQFGNVMATGGVGGAPTSMLNNLVNTGVAGGGGVSLANLATGTSNLTNPLSQTFMGAAPTQAGLQGMIAGGGNPINQTPAWNAMVQAQQRNIAEGQAALNEQFNTSDNRFSSSYGTAATDYRNQAIANQNALLGQMTATAGENAQNRLLGAGTTLAQMGAGAGGQMANIGAGAASQTGQLSAGAATGLFGNQNAMLPQFMNYGLGQGQLASGFNSQLLSGAANLGQMNMANLGLGQQLGMGQYGIGQSQINNSYQEWLRTQPQNNPFIANMQQLATYYPSQYTGGYTPGAFGSLMGGAGGVLGGLAMMGVSDERLKENVKKVGSVGDVDLYSYNFKNDSTPLIGALAQKLYKKHPELVGKGDDNSPWTVDYGGLASMLAGKAA